MTIMRGNQSAQAFHTIYLDGFAGPGSLYGRASSEAGAILGEDASELAADNLEAYRRGSAERALVLEKPFDEYIFVDIAPDRIERLRHLQDKYPGGSA